MGIINTLCQHKSRGFMGLYLPARVRRVLRWWLVWWMCAVWPHFRLPVWWCSGWIGSIGPRRQKPWPPRSPWRRWISSPSLSLATEKKWKLMVKFQIQPTFRVVHSPQKWTKPYPTTFLFRKIYFTELPIIYQNFGFGSLYTRTSLSLLYTSAELPARMIVFVHTGYFEWDAF